VYPKPVAAFTPDPVSISVLTPHIDFIDASSGAMYWQWDFGDNSTSIQQYTSHDYADTGTYHVTQVVINQYGCSDTTVRTIIIESEFQFFIPNAFTPNGNVTNEIFNGQGIGIEDYHMMIFDRWGNLIFESTDMNQGWNGTLNNGVKAEIDVYVYKFVLKDVFGNDHTFIGHVSLIR
jgi:gliding motility-associated-like protein